MADEVSIRSALQIVSGNVNYKSEPQSYNDDLSTTKGPVPGALSVSTTGTNVSFSELTTPGWCRMVNQDEINFVTYGIWDGLAFWPFGDLLPGKPIVVYLSRYFGSEFVGTGTGTGGAADNVLRLVADGAECNVLVEAFEAEPL